MTINWNTIWMNLFGRTELFGINMILMNVVFWTRKRFHSYGDSL